MARFLSPNRRTFFFPELLIPHKSRLNKNMTDKQVKYLYKYILCSDAVSGWPGWALAQPEFRSSVNPITTRGADYAHHINASPPGFENPAASLHSFQFCNMK